MYKKTKNSVELKFNKSENSVANLVKIFEKTKVKIKDISTKDSDLEEIFINLLKNNIYIVLIMLCSCSIMKQELDYKDPQSYEFKKSLESK